MEIDRNELAQEILLREYIQETLSTLTQSWVSETQETILKEQAEVAILREVIQNLIDKVLVEDLQKTKQDAAISLVRDTLLAVIKIIKSDQSKFKDSEIQNGFIKYCLLALQNDFQENRAAAGESILDEQFGDDKVDIKIDDPTNDPMFIEDEEEEKEIETDEGEEIVQTKEEELFMTLNETEQVGFRYARDTTWPKVTKQIRRIHKMALPDPEIARIYEEWLTKNIELHGENTKEETAFPGDAAEVEIDVEEEETSIDL